MMKNLGGKDEDEEIDSGTGGFDRSPSGRLPG
jgi:hypothetical protein